MNKYIYEIVFETQEPDQIRMEEVSTEKFTDRKSAEDRFYKAIAVSHNSIQSVNFTLSELDPKGGCEDLMKFFRKGDETL